MFLEELVGNAKLRLPILRETLRNLKEVGNPHSTLCPRFGLEPETRPDADLKLIHNSAIHDNDASCCTDQCLKFGVHQRRQILRFQTESPTCSWKYFYACSDSKCKPCTAGCGSRQKGGTQGASEEWLNVGIFPDKELVGKIGEEVIEADRLPEWCCQRVDTQRILVDSQVRVLPHPSEFDQIMTVGVYRIEAVASGYSKTDAVRDTCVKVRRARLFEFHRSAESGAH